MELNGKTAVVTGGTKGIGRAIAESLIREGANVVITARHAAYLENAVAELNAIDRGRAVGFSCDVRDHLEVRSLVKNVIKTFKRIDVLVNNAGIGIFARLKIRHLKTSEQSLKPICLVSITVATK
jgi:NAD(P)-dependent dehydrogenase (short-subunit alcohol dehydrogenase family)